jgi:transposase
MLSFSGSLRVFVAVEPCDMRKGFNGLHAMASERLGEDPRQGALFVFTNRRHNRIKILYFDGYGNTEIMGRQLEQMAVFWERPRLCEDRCSHNFTGGVVSGLLAGKGLTEVSECSETLPQLGGSS